MKPRIYRRDGIWICRSFGGTGVWLGRVREWMRLGYGYTPVEAYREWSKQ
jgi:hypothetical protein